MFYVSPQEILYCESNIHVVTHEVTIWAKVLTVRNVVDDWFVSQRILSSLARTRFLYWILGNFEE